MIQDLIMAWCNIKLHTCMFWYKKMSCRYFQRCALVWESPYKSLVKMESTKCSEAFSIDAQMCSNKLSIQISTRVHHENRIRLEHYLHWRFLMEQGICNSCLLLGHFKKKVPIFMVLWSQDHFITLLYCIECDTKLGCEKKLVSKQL